MCVIRSERRESLSRCPKEESVPELTTDCVLVFYSAVEFLCFFFLSLYLSLLRLFVISPCSRYSCYFSSYITKLVILVDKDLRTIAYCLFRSSLTGCVKKDES